MLMTDVGGHVKYRNSCEEYWELHWLLFVWFCTLLAQVALHNFFAL